MGFSNIMDLRHFANSTCLDVAWIIVFTKNITYLGEWGKA